MTKKSQTLDEMLGLETEVAPTSSKHYPRIEPRNHHNRKNGGLTKANAYVAGIFTYQYDLEEMLLAFGVKVVTETLIELHNDLKQGKRYADRHKVAKKVRDRRIQSGLAPIV